MVNPTGYPQGTSGPSQSKTADPKTNLTDQQRKTNANAAKIQEASTEQAERKTKERSEKRKIKQEGLQNARNQRLGKEKVQNNETGFGFEDPSKTKMEKFIEKRKNQLKKGQMDSISE